MREQASRYLRKEHSWQGEKQAQNPGASVSIFTWLHVDARRKVSGKRLEKYPGQRQNG